MKKILQDNILLLLASAVLATASCTKNILNTVPQTSLSGTTAFSSPEQVTAGINALYAQVQNASYYGGRYIIFNEQRGDEFSQNDGNNSTGANVWNQSITGSGDFVNAVWSAAYTAINSANLLISNLGTTTVVSDSLRKNYIAEAKFMRAFNYFNLVQTFSRPYSLDKNAVGLPIRLNAELAGGNNSLAFSNVTEVYTQVIRDLDDAEKDLPAFYATAILNASRAHKATAIALKTRVYLVKAEYANLLTEAAKLVPAAPPYQYVTGTVSHRLETSIATVFNGIYTGAEAVFSLPFVNPSETPVNQSALAYNYLYPILTLNTAGIVADPVFAVASPDARKGLLKTNTNGQILLNKFSRNAVPYNDYIPVIRYAEVLLNYAEAAANTNSLVLGSALLQAVRQRSSPGFIFPAASTSSQAALVATILNERRIELLGEGFRTPDLFRRGQTLPAKSGNAGTAPAVAPTALNYVWPVPSNELAYNTLAPR